jgi:hypothetical protein
MSARRGDKASEDFMMFRYGVWIALLIALATRVMPAAAADLSKIDRTIGKEPKYKNKPKYCLFVFGPEAKLRVWLVQDGETLYVDRNGDGDLTGRDEQFAREDPNSSPMHWKCNIEIRDPDKETRYVITGIVIRSENGKYAGDFLDANVDIKGKAAYRQYGGAKLDRKPEKAGIAHFHGPLMIEPRRIWWKLTPELSRLPLGESAGDVSAVVGTMDADCGCWVVVRSEDLPKDLHPVVEVEFPGKKAGDASIKKRYRLEQRC